MGTWDIGYLPSDPAVIRLIAGWHQEQWGHLSDRTLADRIEEFEEHNNTSTIPLTVIASHQGRPIGSASLLKHDMHDFLDLTPWLASVFILPKWREKGLGTLLCQRIEKEASRLQVDKMYLFTPDRAGFYQKMNWSVLEIVNYREETVTLMKLELGK